MSFRFLALIAALGVAAVKSVAPAAEPLRVGVFQVDATPPIGSPLCNGLVKPAREIVTPLTARGIVLLGAGEPIVLCAIDWVGIANESHEAFRAAMAKAARTSIDRVTVHTLHQHDAPGSDFATERLLVAQGLGGLYSNADFDRAVIARLADATGAAIEKAQPVTHLGLGAGVVEKVASNRNIIGPRGKVALQRNSASKNPAAQAAPEGIIDPKVRVISFWNGDRAIAVLSYYATHPQSHYGQGGVGWDFIGMARALREEALPGLAHIHFNGAGGNVAAGKYNDGSPAMRPVLAARVAAGMKLAWESQRKIPLAAAEVRWNLEAVTLPVRDTLQDEKLAAKLGDAQEPQAQRVRAARDLAFVRRVAAGHRIGVTCLQLGPARILHLPGELFIEYQLAAQQLRPEDFVAFAAYGDCGPGYIGTADAYGRGGYETGIVSRVAPEVDQVLSGAIRRLLER